MNFEKRIGHYQYMMNAIIGKGSFGTVFLGKNLDTEEPVAVKVIEKKISNYQSGQQLQSEIESMRDLNNENVVKLYNVFQTQNNIYIISEYCDGGDLRDLINRRQVNDATSIEIIKQILNGYRDLFKNKILHRDIKPANILISKGRFKIADFGFAKRIDNLDDIMTSIAGTPLYMSPQVITRTPYTSKCDIWSIGMIFYELLFKKAPFNAMNIVELIHQMSSKPIYIPKIQHKVRNFISGCLQFNEVDRFGWEDLYKHELWEGYFEEQAMKKKPLEQTNRNSDTFLKKQNVYQIVKTPLPNIQGKQSEQYQQGEGPQSGQTSLKSSYQKQLMQNYIETSVQNNLKIVKAHLNFAKALFNFWMFLSHHSSKFQNFEAQTLLLMMNNLKDHCMSRVQGILQSLQNECSNWMNINELIKFNQTNEGSGLINSVLDFLTLIQSKFGDQGMEEEIGQDYSLKVQESQVHLKQSLQEFLQKMQIKQYNQINLCLLFMVLQLYGVLNELKKNGQTKLIELEFEDIQFVEKIEENELIQKINLIVPQEV